MGLLSWLNPGAAVADTALGIVDGVVDVLQKAGIVPLGDAQKIELQMKVQELLLKDREIGMKEYQLEIAEINSAREMNTSALVNAPKWIKGLAALVTPIGGIGALTVFFGNIFAGWTAWFTRIPLTPEENLTLQLIIAFFFGYRIISKAKGFAGKF